MIKVSHEVPKCLFEQSNSFNDFDYALIPCLKDEMYTSFYKQQSQKEREVWLDNGVFEKGLSASIQQIINGINLITPTYVIAPDVLGNGIQTIKNLFKFLKEIRKRDIQTKIVAVVQGENEKEFINCYNIISSLDRVDIIAFPYDINFYNKYLKENTKKYVLARQIIIDRLIAKQIINYNKKHHLLGCSDPIEFIRYRDNPEIYDFINSVDTSCPIISGYHLQKITEEGLQGEKTKMLLADNLNIKLNKKQKNIIDYNIKMFKKLVGKK